MENSDRWTDAEVQALLNIYATEEIQLEFEGTKRNIKVFVCTSTFRVHYCEPRKTQQKHSSDHSVLHPPVVNVVLLCFRC